VLRQGLFTAVLTMWMIVGALVGGAVCCLVLFFDGMFILAGDGVTESFVGGFVYVGLVVAGGVAGLIVCIATRPSWARRGNEADGDQDVPADQS